MLRALLISSSASNASYNKGGIAGCREDEDADMSDDNENKNHDGD